LSTGYYGRTAISELLLIDDNIRNLIVSQQGSHIIAAKARQQGLLSLRDNGISRAQAGITTLQEVYRVTQDMALGSEDI
jgi:general secretion pathway protein E